MIPLVMLFLAAYNGRLMFPNHADLDALKIAAYSCDLVCELEISKIDWEKDLSPLDCDHFLPFGQAG